jgi:hypothetical protein
VSPVKYELDLYILEDGSGDVICLPGRYELGFRITEDDILHSYCRQSPNLA